MTTVTILAAAASLIATLRANINEITLRTETDPVKIEEYLVCSDYGYENGADMREEFLKVPVSDSEMLQLLSIQRPDGSFTDVDYQNKLRGAWPTEIHNYRVQRLAIRYCKTGDKRALDAALSAMRYWHATMPECPNWWHNEIGVPRVMAPAYLLLQDEMSGSDLEGAVRVLGKSGLRQTGQNKVWQAGNVLIKGMLLDDEALVMQARDSIASELHMSESVEGLQSDWSFHQHGPQLQFGNYGLAYASSLSWWAKAFEGTSLAFSEEQMYALRGYVRNGLCNVIWKGWFDHNACGRQVFLNAQRGKALCALAAAENLGVSLDYPTGGTYYPRSDFGVFRGKDWYASIRMQSTRIKGFETTNDENLKGYFSSDGALLVRRSGDEYNNISAVWNWRHIPGATTYDNGKPLPRSSVKENGSGFYNHSGNVGGKVGEGTMTVWMEYKRDGLSARKAWFFWEGGIVCLGTGISRESGDEVVTTVEQNLLRGEVKTGKDWVAHNGITYVVCDGGYTLDDGPHKGSWRPISPAYPDTEVSEDIFEMYISHGKSPSEATYAYIVIPEGTQGQDARDRILKEVKILRNTPSKQEVRIGGKTLTVNWKSME